MKPPKSRSRRSTSVIEPAWFPNVDGIGGMKGEYIDLDLERRDRLFIRYCQISDSGVELERVRADVTLWRVHTAPLGVDHSKYTHEVWVRLETRFRARLLGRRYSLRNPNGLTGRILICSFGARTINETRELESGKLLSRSLSETPMLTRHSHQTPP